MIYFFTYFLRKLTKLNRRLNLNKNNILRIKSNFKLSFHYRMIIDAVDIAWVSQHDCNGYSSDLFEIFEIIKY